jgi:hypothetical protein
MFTVALPVPPLHGGFVVVPSAAETTDGWVTVTEVVDVHPLLSVTVTVYIPADRPVAVVLVCPIEFHR